MASSDGRVEDERWHVGRSGERFYASGILTAVRDENGRAARVCETAHNVSKVTRDVTERMHAESERERLLGQATQANRMKDEFLSRSPLALRGARVIVVEDDQDSRELCGAVLCEVGADVILAASADEGLAAVGRHRPDVILADIGLPGDDGYAFLRRLRTLAPALRDTPVVAVTAFARGQDRSTAIEKGFAACVSKPVDFDELIAVITRTLARRPGHRT